jgi:hypothetical protein
MTIITSSIYVDLKVLMKGMISYQKKGWSDVHVRLNIAFRRPS